jgi:hypothetical protein
MRLAALIFIALALPGCSAMCGYHGSGCGYIASDKNLAAIAAEQE